MSGGSLNPFKPGSIYEQIGQGVGHTVENIGKNPLPIIMAIALTAITAGAGVGLAAAELMAAEGLITAGGVVVGAEAGSMAAMISAGVNVGIANAAASAINGGNISQIATAGIIGGLTAGAAAGLSGADLLKAVTEGLPPETAQIINSATGKSLTGAVGAVLQGRDPITGAVSGAVSGALSSSLSNDTLADLSKSAAAVLGNAAGSGAAAAIGGKDISTAIANSAIYGTLRTGLSSALNSFNDLKNDFTTTKDAAVAKIEDLSTKSQELLPQVEQQQAAAQESYDKLMQYTQQYNDAKAANDADGMTAAATAFNELKTTYDQQLATFNENNGKLNDWTSQITSTNDDLLAKHQELLTADATLKKTFGDYTTTLSDLGEKQQQIEKSVAMMPADFQQKYSENIQGGADGQAALDKTLEEYTAQKTSADTSVADLPEKYQAVYKNALLSGMDPELAAQQAKDSMTGELLSGFAGQSTSTQTTSLTDKPVQAIYMNGNTVVPLPGGGYAFVSANSFGDGKPEDGTPVPNQYYNVGKDESGNLVTTETQAPAQDTAAQPATPGAPQQSSATNPYVTTFVNAILGGGGVKTAASAVPKSGLAAQAQSPTSPTTPTPQVWNEATGQWQSADSTTPGAMPTLQTPLGSTQPAAESTTAPTTQNAAASKRITDLAPVLVKGNQVTLEGETPDSSAAPLAQANTNQSAYNMPDYTQFILNAAMGGSVGHYATGGQPESPESPARIPTLQHIMTRGRKVNTEGATLPGYEWQRFAPGGSVPEGHNPQFFSPGGLSSLENTYVKGDGDGTSDSVPAMLANGEFVIPADIVSGLGNGSNDAGAKVLDQFLVAVREDKHKNGPKNLPPESKGPLAYLLDAKRKVKVG